MSLHASRLAAAAHDRTVPESPAHAFAPWRLIPATGAALGASLIGVLFIRALAVAGAGHTSRFTPLRPGSVISLTVLGVLLAGATCLWLNRTSNRPLATFRRVALAVLPLSFIPDAAIWLTAHYPQTRAGTVLPLMAMHILVAVVCLVVLPRLGRARTGV